MSRKFDDMTIEDLLENLTAEELELLGEDVDPDDSTIHPRDRCKPQTFKEDTGSYNRRHLLEFLEDTAKTEADWDEAVPYEKKEPKRRWQPPPKEDTFIISEFFAGGLEGMDTHEFDNVLNSASEEEMVDLAAVLGFHSLLTQEQYNASMLNQEQHFGGFHSTVKATMYAKYEDEPANETNVRESIEKLDENNATLKELNLNNIKNSCDYAGIESMAYKEFEDIFNAVKKNTVLEKLSLASTGLTNTSAKLLIDCIKDGKTKIKKLNLESNFLSAESIVAIIGAINAKQEITELYVSNQRSRFGPRAEHLIADAIDKNDCLVKFSIDLLSPGPRERIQRKIRTNFDMIREKRGGAK